MSLQDRYQTRPHRTSQWCSQTPSLHWGWFLYSLVFRMYRAGRDCECSPGPWRGQSLFSNESDYTIPKGLQQAMYRCDWSSCEPGLRVEVVCALKHPLPGYPASGGPRCWGSRRNPIFWCHPAHRPLPTGALPTLLASPKLFIKRNH